jgi:hypothetical protein
MTALYIATIVVGFFLGPFKMLYGGWTPYVVMDSLVAVLGVASMLRVLRNVNVRRDLPIAAPFLALSLYATVGVLSFGTALPLSLMGFRGLVLYSTLFFAGYECLGNVGQIRRIYLVLTLLGTATALFGLWQWTVGPEVVATWGGWYREFSQKMIWTRVSGTEFVFRAFSTFVQPGVFGATMALTMLVTLASFLESRTSTVKRFALLTAFTVMGAGLLVSASRLSLVIVASGAATMILLNRRTGLGLKLIAQTSLIVVIGFWAATSFAGPVFVERFSTIGSSESFFNRWFNPLAEGLRLSVVHPIGLGLGYTTGVPFFVSDEWVQDLAGGGRNVDSGIGAIGAELGILGVCFYLFFVYKVAVSSARAWKALPPGSMKELLVAPAAMGVLGLLLSPIANMMLPSVPPSIIYWFSIGMLLKAPQLVREVQFRPRVVSIGIKSSAPVERIPPRPRLRAVR